VVVPGTTILQVISTAEIWVSAWVDESAAKGVYAGRPARVVFRSDPTRVYHGEVARVSPQTDPETREFLVDVRLREMPDPWSIGQRAEAFVEVARRDGVLVAPQHMVVWRNGEPGFMVVENNQARWRRATLGLRGRDAVEVIQGVSEGRMVVAPLDPASPPLRDGRTVKTRGR
jgi:HlyD family secretion protein